jgi:hypothetical protein
MTKPDPVDPKVKCIQRQKCEIVLLECRSRSEKTVDGRPAERGRGSLAPALGRLQLGVGIPGWENAWILTPYR